MKRVRHWLDQRAVYASGADWEVEVKRGGCLLLAAIPILLWAGGCVHVYIS